MKGEDPKVIPGQVGERGKSRHADQRPGVVATIERGFRKERDGATRVSEVRPICLQRVREDLFPTRPALRVDVERRVELDPPALRYRRGVILLTIGVGRRAGDEAGPREGGGEEEGVVDVALGNLLGADDAAEAGEAGRHRALT